MKRKVGLNEGEFPFFFNLPVSLDLGCLRQRRQVQKERRANTDLSHNKREEREKVVGMSQISHFCCRNFESVL